MAGALLLDAVLADVLDHADHFMPRHVLKFAQSLAQRSRGRAPRFAGKILGNDHHGLIARKCLSR